MATDLEHKHREEEKTISHPKQQKRSKTVYFVD
jgi:hypothetical protein